MGTTICYKRKARKLHSSGGKFVKKTATVDNASFDQLEIVTEDEILDFQIDDMLEEDMTHIRNCCASHCLSSQFDIITQQSALKEILEKINIVHDLYPKFHCELNWIEHCWSDARRIVRHSCDYTLAGLEKNIEADLDKASDV